jgi:hypothetical protein
MALSITRNEKDVRNINETVLRRFADRALMPAEAVLKPAIEISEKIVLTWKQIEGYLVTDPTAKQRVSERMNVFPTHRYVYQVSVTLDAVTRTLHINAPPEPGARDQSPDPGHRTPVCVRRFTASYTPWDIEPPGRAS